jgi:hypothetical protein
MSESHAASGSAQRNVYGLRLTASDLTDWAQAGEFLQSVAEAR